MICPNYWICYELPKPPCPDLEFFVCPLPAIWLITEWAA